MGDKTTFKAGDKTTFKAGDKTTFKAGDKVELYLRDADTNTYSWCGNFTYVRPMGEFEAHRVVSDDSGHEGTCFEGIRHAQTTLDPYAAYDGGEPQYRADLATLDAAAELSKTATGGEWELDSNDNVFSTTPPQAPDDYPRYNAIVEGGIEGAVWFTNPSDRNLILNAARVASAWARMSVYLRGKGVL